MDAYIVAAADRDRHTALQGSAEHARLVREAKRVSRAGRVHAGPAVARRRHQRHAWFALGQH